MSKLVIVESPSKAKSIKGYLGKDYNVVATVGHIRDLPSDRIAVDIHNSFKPKYAELSNKKDVIEKLKENAAKSEIVYLATDPDREGEAISWHVAEILGIDKDEPVRVTFNEITKKGVTTGINAPRKIDMNLVDAQQTRRVLDRIVGYKLSPFLWKKIRRGLSAGRVQSVVVKLIVDREEEIEKFVPEEYWSIEALLSKKGTTKTVKAQFIGSKDGKKIAISNEDECKAILAKISDNDFEVVNVKKGTKTRQPAPPFTTSSLQQDAARKFGMKGDRIMRCAQTLYEGVNVTGYGVTGLITYMRTDSLRISDEARDEAIAYIKSNYGSEALPSKPRTYKAKSGAQDAHEAIRPTNVNITPEIAKATLTSDQYKIYKLIWERFIASMMASCVYNTISVEFNVSEYLFRASGHNVKSQGFTAIYEESNDDKDEKTNSDIIPLVEGDILIAKSIENNQHFTQAPPRYNYATLVKKMEDTGIGRPSTYAPTISNILSKEYVEWEKKTFKPTTLGKVVTELMKNYFKSIVDTKFTADMEKDLDLVESGKNTYLETLNKFYGPFSKTLDAAEKKMKDQKIELPVEETGEICEKCGGKMVIKIGRFGKFIACSNFPKCSNTKSIVVKTPGLCPQCGATVLEKKSKRGFKYYQCEKAPECKFITWDVPQEENCPKCGKSLFKRRGGFLVCLDEQCGFEKKVETKKNKTKE